MNVGKEKGSPGWSGGGSPHPKTWHVQAEQPRWEKRASPEDFLFHVLPPGQRGAVDVSDKETEKQRNA